MNEKLKQQLMLGIVAFNFTVLAYVMYKYLTVRMDWTSLFITILIGAGIGLVTGGIAFFVSGMGK